MIRHALSFMLAVSCAGCWDFVEPDFPEAGAPAVLQANVFVDPAGVATITGLLAPGLTFAGFQREVVNDTLIVYGFGIAPSAIRPNGSREYRFSGPIANVFDRPLELVAPEVEDIIGPPPQVRWFSIQKVGPDTVVWQRGTDLVLRVDTVLATSVPQPQIRQWFLDLRGSDRSFRLSSDGLPPDEIRIPAGFVPAAQQGIIIATLTFFQSDLQRSPANDYIGNISFTVALRWIVKVVQP
ncbi:MAG: hypothetical protein ACT4O1_05250 [Gemmatimonadota bacterium]